MQYFHTAIICGTVWSASSRGLSDACAWIWIAFAILIYFAEKKSGVDKANTQG